MTVAKDQNFNIKSVAIIGAGPSGIATVYDLTRTLKKGESLFGTRNISDYEKDKQLAFDKVVVFERNSTVGGVWSKSAYGDHNNDPKLPDFKTVLDYSKPENLYKKTPIPNKIENFLNETDFKNPITVSVDENTKKTQINQWKGSAAYNGLFTNVTNRYMAYSFEELSNDELEKFNKKYHHLPDFQSAEDVSNYLERVVKNNDLEKHIRFDTNVERVKKLNNGRWEVIVNHITEKDGNKYLNWYREEFDAIVIGNGKSIPVIPDLQGLPEFAEVNKNKVTITLAKAIQNPDFIRKSKKLLFIGSSVSSIDLIQYAFPRDLDNASIFISRRHPTSGKTWVDFCSYAKGIVSKPVVEKFLPAINGVQFSDGSVETGFDTIIIATGYHMYYPFLEESYLKENPNALKFFNYTFSIDDPTLALVGNTYASFFFNRVESQAAALAGVWTNTTSLPPVSEQLKIYESRPPLKTFNIRKDFMDPLLELAVGNRPHPFELNKDKSDHVAHVAAGHRIIEGLFFKVRNGEIDIDKVFN